MRYREPAWSAARYPRSTFLGGLVVLSPTLIGLLGCQSRVSSSMPAAQPSPTTSPSVTPSATKPSTSTASPDNSRDGNGRRATGVASGKVPEGVTVFDDEIPGVANLNPDLLAALRRAATEAAEDGVKLFVNSGWRSPEYQEQLLRKAIKQYGSEEEAARWVATPDKSAHVSGDAVDIGPTKATQWLSKHGAGYGLCQIYRNEPWHYELRPDAIENGPPPMYDDPSQDPRMQR